MALLVAALVCTSCADKGPPDVPYRNNPRSRVTVKVATPKPPKPPAFEFFKSDGPPLDEPPSMESIRAAAKPPKPPGPTRSNASKSFVETRELEVKGFGATDEEAREVAYQRMQEAVEELFKRSGQPLDELPSLDLIRKAAKPKGGIVKLKEPIGGRDREVVYAIDLDSSFHGNSNFLVYVSQQDRQSRAGSRMSLLGRILGFAIAFLAALASYFRLEEATKGYYTTWLRLGAVSFVGMVAVGIWFLR